MRLTRKRAINYSISRWKYLAQLGHNMSITESNIIDSEYPVFKYIPKYHAMCKKYENDNWNSDMKENRCEKCPLFIKWGFNCYHPKSPYTEWIRKKTKNNADLMVKELESIKNPIKFWWNYRFKRFWKRRNDNHYI